MTDKRRQIRMSSEEIWKFIDTERNLQVATINRDGTPHLTTLWFAVDDGCIVFDTYARAQKAVNVVRDARVALLIESGAVYSELRGVSINGNARVVDDEELSIRLKVLIARRYDADTATDTLIEQAERSRKKRVVIAVQPERIASWDHRKL